MSWEGESGGTQGRKSEKREELRRARSLGDEDLGQWELSPNGPTLQGHDKVQLSRAHTGKGSRGTRNSSLLSQLEDATHWLHPREGNVLG